MSKYDNHVSIPFDVKGTFKITLIDVNTGNILDEIYESNAITNFMYMSMDSTDIRLYTYYQPIVPVGKMKTCWLNFSAIDVDTPSPTTSYSKKTTTTPASYKFTVLYSPPSSGTRTINSIILGKYTYVRSKVDVMSYLNLSQTIIQDALMTVKIEYTFEVPLDTPNYDYATRYLLGLLRYSDSSKTNNMFSSLYFSPSYANCKAVTIGSNYNTLTYNNLSIPSTINSTSSTSDDDKFRSIVSWSSTTSDHVGYLYGSFIYSAGSNTSIHSFQPVSNNMTYVVQPVFSHNSSATIPFYNSSYVGTGTGTIQLTPLLSDYSSICPEFYKINIIASGDVPTATYNIAKRKFVGFNGNTYQSLTNTIPFFSTPSYNTTSIATTADPRRHPVKSYGIDVPIQSWGFDYPYNILPYKSTNTITWDANGVTKLNVFSGEYHNFDIDNGLDVSNIAQVSTDDNNIWVSDPTKGLFKIDSNNLVTKHVPLGYVGCGGVDIGRNGSVVALFHDGIGTPVVNESGSPYSIGFSSDAGNSWALYGISSSPTFVLDSVDPRTFIYLKADPSNSSDQVGLMRTYVSGTTRYWNLYWWSKAVGGSVYQGPTWSLATNVSYSNLNHTTMLDVSNNSSTWFVQLNSTSIYKFTYGSTYPSLIASNYNNRCGIWFDKTSSGNDMLILLNTTASSNLTIGYMDVADYSISQMTSTAKGNSGGTLFRACYMGDGVFTFGSTITSSNIKTAYQYISSCTTNSSVTGGTLGYLAWDQYGWNGSSWVLGSSTARATHSDYQTLPGELAQIKFTSGGISNNSFIATNYYTTAIMDGILKNNSNQINQTTGYYTIETSPILSEFTDSVFGVKQLPLGAVTYNCTNTKLIEDSYITTSNIPVLSSEPLGGDFEVVFTRTQILSIPVTFTAVVFGVTMFGSTDISYGFVLTSTGHIEVYESGIYPISGTLLNYGETVSIKRIGTSIHYYINGILQYTSTIPNSSLLLFTSFKNRYVIPEDGSFTLPASIVTNGSLPYTSLGNISNGTGIFDSRFFSVGFTTIEFDNFVDIYGNGVKKTPILPSSNSIGINEVIVTPNGYIIAPNSSIGETISGTFSYLKFPK